MVEARRDRRGRIYWVEPGKGRVKKPDDVDRPRAYAVDTRGRGYWTYLDTGRRAAKPARDEAPRYDSLGRPLDTRGRRVPATSLQPVELAPTVVKAPPKKAPRRPPPTVVKAPPKKAPRRVLPRPTTDVDRPRAYAVDKLGRGYWTYLDTGRRAPKPMWDEAPRYDTLGRPLDIRGRRVPVASLQPVEVALVPPTARTVPPKKAARRVRPAVPPRPPRASLLGPREMVTGFKDDFRKIYTTRPTQTSPKGLEKIFESWAKGAVNKSPVASDVDELSIRQHGVVFVSAYGGLDRTALAELNSLLAGQPVRMVYRATGPNEMEIWMHLNRPDQRTGAIEQRGHGGASSSFKGGEAAANIIYEFLMDYDAEFAWYEYIETDEDLYEG